MNTTAVRDRGDAFLVQGDRFTDRTTADGTSGFPVEAGRYRLVVDPGSARSHRVVITRRLLGLADAVGLVTAVDGEVVDGDWPTGAPTSLPEVYRATDPRYRGSATTPVLYDTGTRRVVSNDAAGIAADLATEWRDLHGADAPDLYPRPTRARFDAFDALIRTDIAEGVYRCGTASTQDDYDDAYQRLFDRLDWFAMMLGHQRYLLGDRITAADVHLFTVLVRFDVVYHGLFRCNRHKLTELPVLWAYARDLFQTPGFGDTVDFARIKRHYYARHGVDAIVPAGPDLTTWHTTHDRDRTGTPEATG